jgi:hypothetical protein
MPSSPAPERRRVLLPLLVVLVAAAAVVAFVARPEAGGNVETIAPGQEKRTAPEGQVIPGFPNELLVEEAAVISESYSIAYSGSRVDQPVVRYMSGMSLADNIAAFRDRLQSDGWTITQDADPSASPAFFYAYKDNAQVNILLVADESGKVQVTVAYAAAR